MKLAVGTWNQNPQSRGLPGEEGNHAEFQRFSRNRYEGPFQQHSRVGTEREAAKRSSDGIIERLLPRRFQDQPSEVGGQAGALDHGVPVVDVN